MKTLNVMTLVGGLCLISGCGSGGGTPVMDQAAVKTEGNLEDKYMSCRVENPETHQKERVILTKNKDSEMSVYLVKKDKTLEKASSSFGEIKVEVLDCVEQEDDKLNCINDAITSKQFEGMTEIFEIELTVDKRTMSAKTVSRTFYMPHDLLQKETSRRLLFRKRMKNESEFSSISMENCNYY
tara:strand:+ start:632 stop:1180 length:549 start_codon:yes stop_codon:yes gene_type:complete